MIQNESTDSNRGNVRLFRGDAYVTMQITVRGHARLSALLCIGLYRDVWIAPIASSRTSLATLTGVMCNTSQCELHSLRVNSDGQNSVKFQDKSTQSTPFSRFLGAIVQMEVFTVVLDDSSSHVWK